MRPDLNVVGKVTMLESAKAKEIGMTRQQTINLLCKLVVKALSVKGQRETRSGRKTCPTWFPVMATRRSRAPAPKSIVLDTALLLPRASLADAIQTDLYTFLGLFRQPAHALLRTQVTRSIEPYTNVTTKVVRVRV